MPSTLTAVVLAAGEGTRMRSDLPKPLHPVGGRPMICHVLEALAGVDALAGLDALAGPGPGSLQVVVVVGHRAEQVTQTVTDQAPPGLTLHFAEQSTRRGTGHAVTAALASGSQFGEDVLVVPADTPLLRSETLAALLEAHRDASAAATVLTARLTDPTGYGRVVRDQRQGVARIVEQRDATPAEAAIDEVNTSIYCFQVETLKAALAQLSHANAQGELYLTDTIAILRAHGQRIAAVLAADPTEVAGVNDTDQLAAAEEALRTRLRYRPPGGTGIQKAT